MPKPVDQYRGLPPGWSKDSETGMITYGDSWAIQSAQPIPRQGHRWKVYHQGREIGREPTLNKALALVNEKIGRR